MESGVFPAFRPRRRSARSAKLAAESAADKSSTALTLRGAALGGEISGNG